MCMRNQSHLYTIQKKKKLFHMQILFRYYILIGFISNCIIPNFKI